MAFQPEVNQQINIDGVAYTVAEHPAAPGIPYGQEGRAGTVFKLLGQQNRRALKVFRPVFRVPGMVAVAKRLAAFSQLPGLQVCQRTVLTPNQHYDLLRSYPDLIYSVVMPWIEGPTWVDIVGAQPVLSPLQSLSIAQEFAQVLVRMEQEGLAHCDLSGPNVMLPMLADPPQLGIQLVDVEQMYGPGLNKPEVVPLGSAGYGHKTAPRGVWDSDADRFSGAVLLAEMLGWCDRRVRDAAWGESYFDPAEVQLDGERYNLLLTVLRERYPSEVARLFDLAWHSQTLPDCPAFGYWMVALPDTPDQGQVIVVTTHSGADALGTASGESGPGEATTDDVLTLLSGLLTEAGALERQGATKDALALYREASSLAHGAPALQQTISSRIEALQAFASQGEQAQPGIPGQLQATTSAPSPAVLRGMPATASDGHLAPGEAPAAALAAHDRGAQAAESRPLQEAQRVESVDAYGRRSAGAPTPAMQPPLLKQQGQRSTVRTAGIFAALLVVVAVAVSGFWLLSSQGAGSGGSATPTTLAQAAATPSIGKGYESSPTVALVNAPTTQPNAAFTFTPLAVPASTASPTAVPPSPTATSERVTGVLTAQNAGGVIVVQTIAAHDSRVTSLAFSRDGGLIVSGSDDQSVRVFRTSDGSNVAKMQQDSGFVVGVAFSPDAKIVASASSDQVVRLWKVSDGSLITLLKGHTGAVNSVAFSPDGRLLASGAEDKTVRLWNVADGQVVKTFVHPVPVFSVVFSPDGSELATGADDGIIRMWSVDNGAKLQELKGHELKVVGLDFSATGQLLVSASHDATVRLWPLPGNSSSHILVAPGGVNSVAVSPDGSLVAGAGGPFSKTLWLWKAEDGTLVKAINPEGGEVARSIAFSPLGQFIAVAFHDGTVRLWGLPPH